MLAVLLMLLVGALFVADRIAAGMAEDRIAQETKKALVDKKVSFAGEPDVSVTGFPFLTQVLDGKYKKITIVINQPEINQVKLNALQVEARAVRADARSMMNGTGEVIAGEVSGIGTMSWENVRPLLELAGLPSTIDPAQVELTVVNNKVVIRVPLTYQGFKFALIAKGSMIVEQGKVRLKLEELASDQGSAPKVLQDLIKRFGDRLQVTLRLPGLPYNLVINKVESSDAGLLVIASAKDVKLNS